MKILVVEDNEKVGQFVRKALSELSHTVVAAASCREAEDRLAEANFNLVVLDLGLPDGDGLTLLRRWREAGFDEPVLILSARSAVDDRVTGLDLGADVYLPKPFSVDELLANVRALLRRQAAVKRTVITHRSLKIDLISHTLTMDDRPVELTSREFALMEVFLQNAGRVLTRTFITERIWASNFDVDTNLLDVYMSRLRNRLEADGEKVFRTVRGVGYQLL